jgi:hypothetical protein
LAEIPTTSALYVFILIDIDAMSPNVETYPSDPTIEPPGIDIAAPIVTRVSVPEPASAALLAIGLVGLLLTRRAVG